MLIVVESGVNETMESFVSSSFDVGGTIVFFFFYDYVGVEIYDLTTVLLYSP